MRLVKHFRNTGAIAFHQTAWKLYFWMSTLRYSRKISTSDDVLHQTLEAD